MAVIGKIRKHSWLLVVVIGVALFAFIIGDFSRNQIKSDFIIGDVDGEEIHWQEFERLVEKNAQLQQNAEQSSNLTADQMYGIRQRTWNEFQEDIILGKEYDDLGLNVTEEEMQDLLLGDNPHPFIVQNFKNQQTGKVDKELIINMMQMLDQRPPEFVAQVENLLFQIRKDVNKKKYNTLITKGYYAPSAIAAFDYGLRNKKSDFNIVGLKASDISDEEVAITEAQLITYYNDNIERFKQTKSRDLEYVVFKVNPSVQDRLDTKATVDELEKELRKEPIADVPAFVNQVSDVRYNGAWLEETELPAALRLRMNDDKVGTIYPTYFEHNAFHTARLLNREMRPDSIKAQHILIAYEGAFRADTSVKRNKEMAQQLADSLERVFTKKRAKLADLAPAYSNDVTAVENKGDLGWFNASTMIPEFTTACIENNKGTFTVVETVLGYHVIYVEDKLEAKEKFNVAVITRNLIASTETRENKYREASAFAANSNDVYTFRTLADSMSLNIQVSEKVQPMSNNVNGITYPRQVIRWAYNQSTELGGVSDVFNDDQDFVVASLTAIFKEGTATFDEVKDQITPFATKELKATMQEEKLAAVANMSLEEAAKQLATTVVIANNIAFSSYNVPEFGREQKVIGVASILEQNQKSKVVLGDAGAYMIEVTKITPAVKKTDFSSDQERLERQFASMATNALFRSLQEESEIEDNRVEFY